MDALTNVWVWWLCFLLRFHVMLRQVAGTMVKYSKGLASRLVSCRSWRCWITDCQPCFYGIACIHFRDGSVSLCSHYGIYIMNSLDLRAFYFSLWCCELKTQQSLENEPRNSISSQSTKGVFKLIKFKLIHQNTTSCLAWVFTTLHVCSCMSLPLQMLHQRGLAQSKNAIGLLVTSQ